MKLPELLVGVGNLSKLKTAAAFGADAVYCGASGLSMRPDGSSFTLEQLRQAADLCRRFSVRLYVAANRMMMKEDLENWVSWLDAARDIPLDAVIVGDAGAFQLAKQRRPDLDLHISTQLSTSNPVGVRFWQEAGASRVVLARECSLAHLTSICSTNEVEVEVFVHGAMCMAVSGRCLLSAGLCGKSANRGECKQTCRWEWEVVEKKRPDEPMDILETGRDTLVFGSTDLCLIDHLPDLVGSGVHSLKVEGRMKSEYYVAMITQTYRNALDRFAATPHAFDCLSEWKADLESVPHRPYASGFARGYPERNPGSLQTAGRPVSTHLFMGLVLDASTLDIRNRFSTGEDLEWFAPGGKRGILRVPEMKTESGAIVERCHAGTRITVDHGLPEYAVLRKRIC